MSHNAIVADDMVTQGHEIIDLSIIIVGTNEKDFILNCLCSIAQSVHSYQVETILVDNASSDGTYESVRQHYPDVRVIRQQERMGYIENNNAAIEKAQGRYFLVLNADITLEPKTLAAMIQFMETHPEAAVSGCKLLFEDGSLQLTCRRFPTPKIYLSRLPHFFRWVKKAKRFAKNDIVKTYLMLDYDHETTRPVDWVLSAFFLMRRSVVEDIGAFSKKLVSPFYLEDVEWCFRAHLKGYRVYYVPEVQATHYYKRGSVSVLNKLSFVHMANIVIFFATHGWAMLRKQHRKVES